MLDLLEKSFIALLYLSFFYSEQDVKCSILKLAWIFYVSDGPSDIRFWLDLEQTWKYRTSNFPNLKKTEPQTFTTLVCSLKPNFEPPKPPKKDRTMNQTKGSYCVEWQKIGKFSIWY